MIDSQSTTQGCHDPTKISLASTSGHDPAFARPIPSISVLKFTEVHKNAR